jgi:hypothetical protein
MPSTLSDLAATLADLEPAATMAEAARLALLQKEAQALQEILSRVRLLMTRQDAKIRESCYRHEITLLEISERARTGENSGLRISTRLVFCDDQRLIRRFEVEQWGGCAFQIQDEQELTYETAVKSYGLDAICAGLQGELLARYPMKEILTGCQERLLAATKMLEELRKGGTAGIL